MILTSQSTSTIPHYFTDRWFLFLGANPNITNHWTRLVHLSNVSLFRRYLHGFDSVKLSLIMPLLVRPTSETLQTVASHRNNAKLLTFRTARLYRIFVLRTFRLVNSLLSGVIPEFPNLQIFKSLLHKFTKFLRLTLFSWTRFFYGNDKFFIENTFGVLRGFFEKIIDM